MAADEASAAKLPNNPDSAHGIAHPEAVPARLLNLHQAAAYLGLSWWTVRAFALDGVLPVVRFPSTHGRTDTLRRVLVDRADLDRLVERFKEAPTGPVPPPPVIARTNRRGTPPPGPRPARNHSSDQKSGSDHAPERRARR